MQLTQSFSLADLTQTNTGIDNTPDQAATENLKKLAMALQKVEDKLGPVKMVSGYRSLEVNSAVGGSPTSRHKTGEAADFYPRLQSAEKFWTMILADASLKRLFGEISYKKHQGTIHVTLPYFNISGVLVQGSARVADPIYRSQTQAQIDSYFEKYGVKPVSYGGLGIGFLMAGLSALTAIFVIKRRN